MGNYEDRVIREEERREQAAHRVTIEFDCDFAPRVKLICPDGCKGDEEGGCQLVGWVDECGNEILQGTVEGIVTAEWPPTEDGPTLHLEPTQPKEVTGFRHPARKGGQPMPQPKEQS